jgi:hypothetical protein
MNVMLVEIHTPPTLGYWPKLALTIRSSRSVPCESVVAEAPERPTPGAPPLRLPMRSGRQQCPLVGWYIRSWHDSQTKQVQATK